MSKDHELAHCALFIPAQYDKTGGVLVRHGKDSGHSFTPGDFSDKGRDYIESLFKTKIAWKLEIKEDEVKREVPRLTIHSPAGNLFFDNVSLVYSKDDGLKVFSREGKTQAPQYKVAGASIRYIERAEGPTERIWTD